MAAVSEDGLFTPEDRPFSEVSRGYTPFIENDVIVAKITPCFENGKAAHLNRLPHGVGFGSTEFHVIRSGPRLYAPYLYRFITSAKFRGSGQRRMTGSAGQQRVPAEFLRSAQIPLPPLEEQKRIAAILDKADEIRRKREQAIQLADAFLRSLFLDMFGDPIRNPKGWPRKQIRDIGTVVTGNTPPRDNSEFYGGEIEWIKSDNLNNSLHLASRSTEFLSQAARHKARIVPPGSLLVTCIAGSYECIGNLALVDREVAFNQQINAIIPNASTDSIFLYVQCLLAKRLIQEASTASMKGMVSKGRFEELFLPSPPQHVQKEFSKLFSRWSHIRYSEGHHETVTLAKCFSISVFRSE